MSYIGAFLGTLFGNGPLYSEEKKECSKERVEKIVSQTSVKSLSEQEQEIIRKTILAARDGQRRISLQKISSILQKLENQHKISKFDHRDVMKQWQQFFESR